MTKSNPSKIGFFSDLNPFLTIIKRALHLGAQSIIVGLAPSQKHIKLRPCQRLKGDPVVF